MFKLIWSPILFWTETEALGRMLEDHRRLLHPSGRLITILPATTQTECLLFPELEKFAPDREWVASLDRGVAVNFIRHAKSLESWEQEFSARGLKISRHDTFLPELVSKAYQIGFRPFFPVLMKMYEALERAGESSWTEVKANWIETAYHFLAPLCESNWMEKSGSLDTWHVFELVPAAEDA